MELNIDKKKKQEDLSDITIIYTLCNGFHHQIQLVIHKCPIPLIKHLATHD